MGQDGILEESLKWGFRVEKTDSNRLHLGFSPLNLNSLCSGFRQWNSQTPKMVEFGNGSSWFGVRMQKSRGYVSLDSNTYAYEVRTELLNGSGRVDLFWVNLRPTKTVGSRRWTHIEYALIGTEPNPNFNLPSCTRATRADFGYIQVVELLDLTWSSGKDHGSFIFWS